MLGRRMKMAEVGIKVEHGILWVKCKEGSVKLDNEQCIPQDTWTQYDFTPTLNGHYLVNGELYLYENGEWKT